MALILKKLSDGYDFVVVDLADPRVKSYFLMSSPFPILCLLGFYLYFVLKLGPRLMKHRSPFDLDRILVFYNISQIVVNLYLVIQALRYTFFKYSFICEPVDYSSSEVPLIVARCTWIYFITKVVDLLDTVFFVLRNKSNQITFLHVYHHVGMCIVGWIGTKYIAGGHGIFLGVLNCVVHIVMYFYYLLSAWDKEYKKNIWWKKYITQLQMVQFMILVLYFGQILFQPTCGYPKWAAWILVTQNFLMLILFRNFYVKTYAKPKDMSEPRFYNSLYFAQKVVMKHKGKSSHYCSKQD